MADWISAKERLPKVEQEVLAFCKSKSYNGTYQCQAFYVPEHTVDIDGSTFDWDFEACDYEEESDAYWLREGWYERIYNWDDCGAVAIGDDVTHWQPLPPPPKEVPHE